MKKNNKIALTTFLFSFITTLVFAAENKIIISGNKRISNETIINNIGFKTDKKYSIEDINEFQKKLYKTNFFSEVNIKLDNNKIIINVNENPIIDFFYIDGVVNKSREDFFYEKLNHGQNRIFSESNLKKDLDLIKKNYQSAGFFDVKVESKISKISGNAVNLIYEISRNSKYEISRIFFIGNKNYSSSELLDVISSSESGWWKLLSSTTTVQQSRIDYDIFLLKEFYLDNGYYDVQVFSSDIDISEGNKVNLTFSIDSGRKYFFSKSNIIDDEKNLSDADVIQINKIIQKKLKGNFSNNKIRLTRNLIQDYLRKNKIDFVELDIGSRKSEEQNIIETNFIFKNSKRVFVNLINVKGNDITEESVIRRNLTFAEGDSFLKYKLKKSVDNLKATKIFKDVKTSTNDIGNEKVDLEIEVEEQPTGSVSAGVGVGSAGSTVSTSVNENNLFGKGITLRSSVNIGTQKISGNIGVKVPDFKFSGNTFGYDVYALSTDYENAGYESKVIGNSTSLTFDIYEDLSITTGLGIDLDEITAKSSASALYKARAGDYVTLKSFYSVSSDKRNSRFLPTNGYQLGFGQSLGMPGSDIPYLENRIFGKYYHPLSEKFILNLKGGLSSINSLNNKDVKLSDRKFLSQSNLRGFEAFGVGPIDGKDHIGGNYSAYSSVSTTVPNPMPDKWNAKSIIFLDAGNVWGVDYNSSLDKNKIRSAAGFSLEWISPLGPLSFTLSETISKSSTDLDEGFSFQLGSTF